MTVREARRLTVDRGPLVEWYLRNRERSRLIFDLIDPAAYYSRPIALRNPIVFYEGHLPAFSIIAFLNRGLGRPGVDARLEQLFARATGNGVATPIFASIMEAVWTQYPREELAPPSKEVKQQIAALDATAVGRGVVGLTPHFVVPRVRKARQQAEPFFLFEGRRQRWREGRRGGFFGFFGRTNRVR